MRFGQVVNVLLVLVQLVTVWVLWLTYTNTVIPSRQKELLAEQLAQLKIEKQSILGEIDESKGRLATLVRQAKAQGAEISSLSDDKSHLLFELKGLSANAISANAIAKTARAKLSESNKSLSLTQASIFSEQAAYIIAYPQMSDGVRETNSARNKDDKDSYEQMIGQAEKAWPDFGPIMKDVEANLRQMRSPLYPNSWGGELADYLSHKMQGFSCVRPQFAVLKKRYKDLFAAAQVEARVSAIRAEQNIVEDGKSQGIRYVFDPGQRAKDIESFEISSRIGVDLKLTLELHDLRSKCMDQFTKTGWSAAHTFVPR